MKRKIKIPNDAEIILQDQTAEANNKYLPVKDKIVIDGNKQLNSMNFVDSLKKERIVSTAEKINSAIINAEWGQTS